jgi:hypothetical protein
MFLPISDFPRYKISTKGVIRSKRGVLSLYARTDGYLSVKLYRKEDGKTIRKGKLVHRLVAETFLPNPLELKLVNHKDGNKTNNRVENLEWCTHRHNTNHAHENNLIGKWERKVIHLLPEGKKVEYSSITEASKDTGIPIYTISKHCKRKNTDWVYNDSKSEGHEVDLTSDDWRQIRIYPDYYVSKTGQIYSTKRNKMMSVYTPSKGYPRVKFMCGGRGKCVYVHTLVAQTFLPPVEGKPYINHKDGNKHNMSVDNLEWCTLKENSQHAVDTGLCPKPKGKAVKQYDDMWNLIASFESLKIAAEAVPSSYADGISLVCRGKQIKSGGYRWKWAE